MWGRECCGGSRFAWPTRGESRTLPRHSFAPTPQVVLNALGSTTSPWALCRFLPLSSGLLIQRGACGSDTPRSVGSAIGAFRCSPGSSVLVHRQGEQAPRLVRMLFPERGVRKIIETKHRRVVFRRAGGGVLDLVGRQCRVTGSCAVFRWGGNWGVGRRRGKDCLWTAWG